MRIVTARSPIGVTWSDAFTRERLPRRMLRFAACGAENTFAMSVLLAAHDRAKRGLRDLGGGMLAPYNRAIRLRFGTATRAWRTRPLGAGGQAPSLLPVEGSRHSRRPCWRQA